LKGKRSPHNPWGARGLEWTHVATPPITENFSEKVVVDFDAYAYDPEADAIEGLPEEEQQIILAGGTTKKEELL
jgi:hypothetical protein